MSDSVRVTQGCRVSTRLSNGKVTTDPGGSCWWRAGLGWEGDEGEDRSTSISLWNLHVLLLAGIHRKTLTGTGRRKTKPENPGSV